MWFSWCQSTRFHIDATKVQKIIDTCKKNRTKIYISVRFIMIGELVFLEYGVVGEVGCNLVQIRILGEEVAWRAEWVGVIRLSGPAYKGVSIAWGRVCGHDNGFAAITIVGGGSMYRAIHNPLYDKGFNNFYFLPLCYVCGVGSWHGGCNSG